MRYLFFLIGPTAQLLMQALASGASDLHGYNRTRLPLFGSIEGCGRELGADVVHYLVFFISRRLVLPQLSASPADQQQKRRISHVSCWMLSTSAVALLHFWALVQAVLKATCVICVHQSTRLLHMR